jgi:U3 small nucleolar RNA-associated protein 14
LTKKEKEDSTNKEDNSIDQYSQGVDFLMDENILTNESREETDSQNMRTPGGIKSLNINSINAINSAGFSN